MLFSLISAFCTAATGAAPGVQSSHQKMITLLARLAETRPYGFDFVGDVAGLRAALDALPDDAADLQRAGLLGSLGASEFEGGIEGGIEHMQAAFDLAGRVPTVDSSRLTVAIAYQLGVAHFREAQVRECVTERHDRSCIVALPTSARYVSEAAKRSARSAVSFFRYVLDHSESNSPRYVASMWILNLAAMGAGESIPAQHRIDPQKFYTGAAFPFFENVAASAGFDAAGYAGGVIADDFDNDGFLDLMVSSVHANYQVRLFRNTGTGTFVDVTAHTGLTGIFGGLYMVQADYDNDGDLDVLIPRGAWLGREGRLPVSLLRNNGDMTFTDVTFDVGLGEASYPSQTVVWVDFDNDGDLDLFAGNESTPDQRSPCQLYRNEGNGKFIDVAAIAGVENFRFTKAVVAGDYDGDGYADLYVSNMGDANRLYRNNRDGTFTDVAGEVGVAGPRSSFSSWFWDVDNDGDLDLLVNSYPLQDSSIPLAQVAAPFMGLSTPFEMMALYINDGKGGFADAGGDYGIRRPVLPMGSNFGDLDNDGYLDFYLATGYMTYDGVTPNIMYRNVDGKRFEDVTFAGGFGHLAKGHSIAFADVDNDGDQDVVTRLGGALLHDISYDTLHENPGFGNHWITVKLTGSVSNRSAIGVGIRVDIKEGGSSRSIYRTVGTGGSFGANPLRAEIGLGKAERIELLEIHWPASNTTQSFREVGVDQAIGITEGQDRLTVLNHPKLVLGGVGS